MSSSTTPAYVPRLADAQVVARMEGVGAVVIEGPKACGKTETARQHAASEVLLDVDVQAFRAAQLDPRLILEGPTPRLIDEWQREPLVWDAVRRAVDDRRKRGQFILTGSATPNDEVGRHSGAGRIGLVRMRPMTLSEQGFSTNCISLAALLRGDDLTSGTSNLSLSDYVERIVVGGWPQSLGANTSTAMEFIQNYLNLIVEHDIAQVSGVRRDSVMVRRFLDAYAQLSSHPAKLSTIIARAQGEKGGADKQVPSRWTAQPYLDALQRMMIIDEIAAWSPTLRSRGRLVSVPKRHLVDPSLAAGLLECSPQRLLSDLNTLGYLFETLAARDLRVYAENLGGRVFHYRERAGTLEADLIVENTDSTWAAFEVKLGGNMIDEAAAALTRLAHSRVAKPPQALAVLTGTEYAYRRADGVWVIPLGCLGP